MLERAFAHSLGEIGLHTLWESLKVDIDAIRKCHDSIHEFIYLAPMMVPHEGGATWHERSAFLLYHWEIGDGAHRSLLEALCGYYNSAFTLLRSVLELALKGAFYEGLAHREFRETSQALEKDSRGRNLKLFLQDLIRSQPSVCDDFEGISASLYDRIESIIDQRAYRPSVKTILGQLCEWGFLDPIQDHGGIMDAYMRLSRDVHVLPDYTNIGRVLLKEPAELFEPKSVDMAVLREYLAMQSYVIDICMVVELNILRDNVRFPDVRSNLAGRVQYLKDLGMANTLLVAEELLRT